MEYFSNSQIINKLKFFIISSIFVTFIFFQQAFSQNKSCLEEDKICNWIKKVVTSKIIGSFKNSLKGLFPPLFKDGFKIDNKKNCSSYAYSK